MNKPCLNDDFQTVADNFAFAVQKHFAEKFNFDNLEKTLDLSKQSRQVMVLKSESE